MYHFAHGPPGERPCRRAETRAVTLLVLSYSAQDEGSKASFSNSQRRQKAAVGCSGPPASISKQGKRVPGQGAPPLIEKQKMKHPRSRYSDLWLVCYSSFIPTTALVFTLLQSMCLLKNRQGTFKSPEGRWNRFGRNEGRCTVGGLKTWVLGVTELRQC